MARSYSRNKTPPKRRQASRKPAAKSTNTNTGWVWLVVGLLLGLCLAAAMYFQQHKGEPKKSHTIPLEPTQKPKREEHHPKKTRETATAPQQQQPQFDFYTILPKLKVDNNTTQQPTKPNVQIPPPPSKITVPASPAVKSASTASLPKPKPIAEQAPVAQAKPTKPLNTTSTPTTYWIQAAVKNSYDQADGLRAQLLMLGYDVKLRKINSAKATSYSLEVGPYPTKAKAEAALHDLRQNGYKATLK